MSRGNHSGDSKRYYDWLYHAYQDMLAARLLITDKRLYAPAVFHCQQAIEKSLKGFLLYKTRRLNDGHNVTWLCKQAALLDECFKQWLPQTTSLNKYYIETRYPADIPQDISYSDAQDMLRTTEEIMEAVCGIIKFDYNSYHKRSKK
ncbi:MAG: HEPN domain-containing protein [Oscillospiraceae bacterium]